MEPAPSCDQKRAEEKQERGVAAVELVLELRVCAVPGCGGVSNCIQPAPGVLGGRWW